MYTDILNEERVSFKELEQVIYADYCEAAREATVSILMALDDKLARERDKAKYRDKGKRRTTIKTVYGEVEYWRHVYEVITEEGKRAYVYLLDEYLKMEKFGMVSTNLAEKIGETIVKTPFRATAEVITKTTGQSISHGGVWNVVQMLGEKLKEDEERMVNEYRTGSSRGKESTPILFEEMDGVWLKMQGKGAKKAPGQEVKIATTYEGWNAGKDKRSTLAGKTVIAGIEDSTEFLEKREAKICEKYDVDLIGQRILNGDGGAWIEDRYDPDTIKQLDRYHVVKAIKRGISHADFSKEMLKKLKNNSISEMIEDAQIYYDSVATADGDSPEEKAAKELLTYLKNNRNEISRYHERGLKYPSPPQGIVYKNMGVQENQNCTVITLRMKGKRKRWKPESANHMVKLLYYNENKELIDTLDRYSMGEFLATPIIEELPNILSAAKVSLVDGKGNDRYAEAINVHLPILDSSNSRTVRVFRELMN